MRRRRRCSGGGQRKGRESGHDFALEREMGQWMVKAVIATKGREVLFVGAV